MAVHISQISKSFLLPHERRGTLKNHFIHLFRGRLRYERFHALTEVSFDLKEGEWIGMIGSNGSGKSTLLKIISGIFEPDAGTVEYKGRSIPFLELGAGLHPELTVRDNIFMNSILLGMTKREVNKRFDEILDFAELRNFVDQQLKNISSGMKLRLAFAVALTIEAELYLIDEIMSVGDYNFQKKSLSALKEKAHGKNLIFVSHDLEQVEQLCHRVVWLNKGRVMMYDRPEKVIPAYKAYSNNPS